MAKKKPAKPRGVSIVQVYKIRQFQWDWRVTPHKGRTKEGSERSERKATAAARRAVPKTETLTLYVGEGKIPKRLPPAVRKKVEAVPPFVPGQRYSKKYREALQRGRARRLTAPQATLLRRLLENGYLIEGAWQERSLAATKGMVRRGLVRVEVRSRYYGRGAPDYYYITTEGRGALDAYEAREKNPGTPPTTAAELTRRLHF